MADRDFSAWKVDDKKWVAERKKGWKSVRLRIEANLAHTNKDQLIILKSYYLTGRAPDEWREELPYVEGYADSRPLSAIKTLFPAILFECWLSADTSDESWQSIKTAYKKSEKFQFLWDEARDFIRLQVLRGYPDEGALFDGLEERLYRFFGPTRFRKEEFPELSESAYITRAANTHRKIRGPLAAFLAKGDANPHHMVRFMVREWGDTLIPTQAYYGMMSEKDRDFRGYLLPLGEPAESSRYRLLCPEKSLPEQVEAAREVDAILTEVRLQLPEVGDVIDKGFEMGEARAREMGCIL